MHPKATDVVTTPKGRRDPQSQLARKKKKRRGEDPIPKKKKTYKNSPRKKTPPGRQNALLK